jgi:hypothetical protein
MQTSARKHLIFTSAGDSSNINLWLEGNTNFDLWICYYGDNDCNYEHEATYFTQRKGGKYQNLHFFIQQSENIFLAYDSILVMDDDIIINTNDINALFQLHSDYGLTLLQPAFDKTGKISHPITARKPFTKMRYTNFVEVTAPVFGAETLVKFMKIYDPTVNATGVDWWFCHIIDSNSNNHDAIAISDEIWCTNPHDLDKSNDGVREIDRLLSNEERIRTWKIVKEKNHLNNINEGDFATYKSLYHFNLNQILAWMMSYPLDISLRFIRKMKILIK